MNRIIVVMTVTLIYLILFSIVFYIVLLLNIPRPPPLNPCITLIGSISGGDVSIVDVKDIDGGRLIVLDNGMSIVIGDTWKDLDGIYGTPVRVGGLWVVCIQG